MKASLLVGTIVASALVFSAHAADEIAAAPEEEATYPYIEGELELELGNDWFVRSDDLDNELNDLYLKSTLGLAVYLNPYLLMNVGLTFEPVLDPFPGRHRTFGDHGLYMDTLNLEGRFGGFTVTAGKFGAASARHGTSRPVSTARIWRKTMSFPRCWASALPIPSRKPPSET